MNFSSLKPTQNPLHPSTTTHNPLSPITFGKLNPQVYLLSWVWVTQEIPSSMQYLYHELAHTTQFLASTQLKSCLEEKIEHLKFLNTYELRYKLISQFLLDTIILIRFKSGWKLLKTILSIWKLMRMNNSSWLPINWRDRHMDYFHEIILVLC